MTRKDRAYQGGRLAHEGSRGRKSNPYLLSGLNVLEQAWDDGWVDAQGDAHREAWVDQELDLRREEVGDDVA